MLSHSLGGVLKIKYTCAIVSMLIVQKRIEKTILSNKFIPENSMCID